MGPSTAVSERSPVLAMLRNSNLACNNVPNLYAVRLEATTVVVRTVDRVHRNGELP